MPIEREIFEEKRVTDLRNIGGVRIYRLSELGREAAVMEGGDPAAVGRAFKGLLRTLRKVLFVTEEPMINVAGFQERGIWRLVIFPRRKHRPDAFFLEGERRVVVSPGVIDMGGVLVTPMEKDFERLNAAAVEGIYEEVSLEARILTAAINDLD